MESPLIVDIDIIFMRVLESQQCASVCLISLAAVLLFSSYEGLHIPRRLAGKASNFFVLSPRIDIERNFHLR